MRWKSDAKSAAEAVINHKHFESKPSVPSVHLQMIGRAAARWFWQTDYIQCHYSAVFPSYVTTAETRARTVRKPLDPGEPKEPFALLLLPHIPRFFSSLTSHQPFSCFTQTSSLLFNPSFDISLLRLPLFPSECQLTNSYSYCLFY